MNKPALFARSWKDIVLAVLPWFLVFAVISFFAAKYVDPAPPNHFVITTGEGEGDYQAYAKQYKDIIKEEGVNLEVRASSGATENFQRLKDENSDVNAGFVRDGLGTTEEAPNLVSLGSLYYEPLWIFYTGTKFYTRLSDLKGKRLAIGGIGSGTRSLTLRLLNESGVDEKNSIFLPNDWNHAIQGLQEGQVDIAFFLATPEEPQIKALLENRSLHLLSLDQAEAISRRIPYLHHLVLPHGAIDIGKNLPDRDVDLVAPTATLLVKDTLHPALVYLLLKAAAQVHSEPGIFEKKNEFPIDKDYEFPLSDDAKYFYKSGIPFWQRYLPFWIATLVDRFIFWVIPMLALLIPMVKLVPQFLRWRIRNRIYQRYGELKYLETQVLLETSPARLTEYLHHLDKIEERVNGTKVPLEFAEHIYSLRGHIEFVRERLRRKSAEAPSV